MSQRKFKICVVLEREISKRVFTSSTLRPSVSQDCFLRTSNPNKGLDKQTFVLESIESVGGSKAEAARRLGVTPQHLQYILGDSKSAKTKKLKSEETNI